jgi:riboflavin biosynthesis pyrimidine reductase
MTIDRQRDQRPDANAGVSLERLAPPGHAASVAEIVDGMGLWERPRELPARPRVVLNMVSTVDGRATLGGRSAPLSSAADRALFHGLRAATDGVLVGAGTVRTERYGRLIPDPEHRALREKHGLADEPLACIVSGRMSLDAGIPLLAEPAARVAILTASAASVPGAAAQIDYVRTAHDGILDLGAALGQLAERFAIRALLCEGGPHLACQLLAEHLLDELFLTLSPQLAGGEPAAGQALRILAGEELHPPAELELLGVLGYDSQLFLRYAVR